jgi:hypothetical protein
MKAEEKQEFVMEQRNKEWEYKSVPHCGCLHLPFGPARHGHCVKIYYDREKLDDREISEAIDAKSTAQTIKPLRIERESLAISPASVQIGHESTQIDLRRRQIGLQSAQIGLQSA